MTITGIKDNVQALLVGMGDYTTVLPHFPISDYVFEGYPAACHYYEGTDPQFATVTQNRRTIQYTVELCIVPKPGTLPTVEFNQAYDLIDRTIQMFDESIDLSSDTLALARACDIMRPAPGELQRVTTPQGDGLVMTLRLNCSADVSFR